MTPKHRLKKRWDHHSHKKGYMTNIKLTDLDEVAIVNFVKDHEEL